MGTGILICGLNGTGKSTLGKVLAEKLQFYFIDHEELCFPKADSHDIYASPRTRKEVEKRLLNEIKTHGSFVYSFVKGDYTTTIRPFFQTAILVDVPKEIRIQRVKSRSFQQFGNRMLPGGDLYEREERFFDFVGSRAEPMPEEWAQALGCPIIRADGTKRIEDNITLIIGQL